MNFNNKTDKKGFGFEYDVSAMFQNQGYLTRRGVPLHYGITNNDATDIDVLGIIFTSPFQGQRIICDCKNKVRSKPYERIFWAKGLGEFVKASNVYVALNKTQWEVIRFASTGGVKVLTSDILQDYNKKSQYGLADASFYEPYELKIQKAAKANNYVYRMISQIKKLYLYENPYVAINIAIELLRNISTGFKFVERHSNEHIDALKYFACELTVITGLQILWICSDVLGLPETARRNHISNKLTFGDLEPKVAENILDTAKDLANEIIRASVPKSLTPGVIDFGEIPPPDYTDSLIGLVERALTRPEWYQSLPQHLDFLLFEQGLKGRELTDEEFMNVFSYTSHDQRFKAARNILSFVRDTCGIDWKNIFNKNELSKTTPSPEKENSKPYKNKDNHETENMVEAEGGKSSKKTVDKSTEPRIKNKENTHTEYVIGQKEEVPPEQVTMDIKNNQKEQSPDAKK